MTGDIQLTPLRRTPRGTGRRFNGAITHHLGAAIVSGEFSPGTVLANEQKFADELNVSRCAYREAVQKLVAKGLVESRSKVGTRVLSRERWNLLDPDVLEWASVGTPDPDLVRGLYEMRAVVEPAAAAFAADRRTRHHVAALRSAVARMTRSPFATPRAGVAYRDFHDIVLVATGNPVMMTLRPAIGAAVTWTSELIRRSAELPRDTLPDHRRVLAAIAAGDPDTARGAMQVLVTRALEDIQLR